MENKRIAVIRIKGDHNVKKTVMDTMNMLRIYNKYSCSIIKSSPTNMGMLNMLRDYVTWGEIDFDSFKLLLEKRGRIAGNKPINEDYLKKHVKLSLSDFAKEFMELKKELKDIPGLKPYFRLSPPIKGFGRKGTKLQFSLGGTLGYRKEKINELLKRMI